MDRKRAWNDVSCHLRFWIPACLGLIADLASKQWAFETLTRNARRVLIPGFLELKTDWNEGMAFGVARGLTVVFIPVSIFALILIVYLFAGSRPSQRAWQIGLGALFAGATGNLYDRIAFGSVRDFIYISFEAGYLRWPYIFNIADVLLVAGVGVLIFCGIFDKNKKTPLRGRNV